jgi:hypothetical protein
MSAILWIIGILVGGVLGGATALGYGQVVEMTPWVYEHQFLAVFSAVFTLLLVGRAMFNAGRSRFSGFFKIVVAGALTWNAIAVAIDQGPKAGDAAHVAFLLKLVVAVFLMIEGYKDWTDYEAA